MKRALIVLCVLLGAWRAMAAYDFTNEFNATMKWASYHSPQFAPGPSYVLGGCYFDTAVYNGNPQFTNHIDGTGQSGESWGQDILTNNLAKVDAPLWASYRVDGYNLVMATGNGGYQLSNVVYTIGTNIANAPGITFNGTAFTNENIPTVQITHWFVGNPLEDGTAASNRNAGCAGLNTTYGGPTFDLYNEQRTNIVESATNYYAGGHPTPGLSLLWGIWQAINMGIDTNVWKVTFNWGAATASSNHIAVSGIAVNGKTLTATLHPTRDAMAWDVPGTADGTADGVTNDARSAFSILPSYGNIFNCILQVTNLPAGNYNIYCNGVLADVATDVQLAAGRNWFTNYATPFWVQRKAALHRDRDKLGCNRITHIAHSAGDTGIISGKADMVNFGSNAGQQYVTNGKRGTNYTAAMQTWVDQVRTNYDVAIFQAQQPATVSLMISPQLSVAIGTLTIGTVHLNQ